ncbi:hypothetical protein [Flagellimonas meishanensis]|uniref:hypothetical protein n=1 Tax=Flagellimonas meishanensis TaxID=2873264 RepID=UPI001CA5FF1A|nr:hypothetical protein [[Muricauda] meishanensis]
MEDGFDNWYFQFASSWGQAWTKDQWEGFMAWYAENPDIDNIEKVPRYVRSWSPKSWLKYNITYLIEKNNYFLYPRVAVATNFSDAGTHVGNDSTIYQVPLDYATNKKYRFSSLCEAKAIYDSFYESEVLYESLGIGKDEVCIDLYGCKSNSHERYLLTSKLLNHKIIRSYGKSLKPHEDNVIRGIEGNELFLYDTAIDVQNPNKHRWDRDVSYNYKQIPFRTVRKLFIEQAFGKVQNLKRKIFKKRRK